MQNDKQDLSIKSEWEQYLAMCLFLKNLSPETLHELKATFYAGCAAMKKLMEENLSDTDEDRGVELMIGWDEEINDFAEQHIKKMLEKITGVNIKFKL